MGFFSSLTGKSQRRDLERAYADSNAMLTQGAEQARGELNTGFDQADRYLGDAMGTVDTGYGDAGRALDRGQTDSLAYLDPYVGSGRDADTLYRNALGLNGVDAQRGFGNQFAASDPFRTQNADMATEAIMRAMNARGMSGSGAALEAVARQNLARGSEDYGNYLTRLEGLRGSGQQAATNASQIVGDAARGRAGLATDGTRLRTGLMESRAGNATSRGNALATLTYGNAQQRADGRMGLGNATAAGRTTGVNNILGGLSTIGGTIFNAFAPGTSGTSAAGNMWGSMNGRQLR